MTTCNLSANERQDNPGILTDLSLTRDDLMLSGNNDIKIDIRVSVNDENKVVSFDTNQPTNQPANQQIRLQPNTQEIQSYTLNHWSI